MNFVSYNQLLHDIRAWSAELPADLVAIAGLPRSGIVPAAQIALHRNLHLVSIDQLKRGETPWADGLRRNVDSKVNGRVLIVDDSVDSGDTIQRVWQELSPHGDFLYGAVYYKPEGRAVVDFAYREIPSPRCFEWNLFHSRQMEFSCLDLDGVICEDWLDREADNGPELDVYLNHLANAKPLFLPISYTVDAIVTARLEKYGQQTEAWLSRHGVKYRELIMSSHPSAAARRAARDTIERKASVYASKSDARLFIESDLRQAKGIAERTSRPVLCVENMQMFDGNR